MQSFHLPQFGNDFGLSNNILKADYMQVNIISLEIELDIEEEEELFKIAYQI